MAGRPGQLVPCAAAVGRAEKRGVFNAGVDGIGVGERRLQMPNAFEFPRVLRAVVPLVRGERFADGRGSVVDEFVALTLGHAAGGGGDPTPWCLPGLAAVAGTLDDLSEPAAGLRGIQAVLGNERGP